MFFARFLKAALAGGVLITGPARAASETVVYSFKGAPDGQYPGAGLVDVGGVLFGTTQAGGAYGPGTVFSVTKAGAETVLHSFAAGGSDGWLPLAGLTYLKGLLFGTTQWGGVNGFAGYGYGTVFSITRAGVESIVYPFEAGNDGEQPYAGLVNVGGTLYGTTYGGGAYGNGTVFSVTPAGVETVIHSFAGNTSGAGDGAEPQAGLVNIHGTLYGTTLTGGSGNEAEGGTVFSITPSGSETVLHSFQGGADGLAPASGLVDVGGRLYGTTGGGGAHNDGTVYSITTSGVEHVLHSFGSGTDYGSPSGLVNVGGTLYGTTSGGGAYYSGTVFSMTKGGSETVLYTFTGGQDGKFPIAGLVDVGGVLYGTTSEGGSHMDGTVFSVTP